MSQCARRLFAAALGLAMLFSLYPAALAESNADAAEPIAELTNALDFGTLPAPVEELDKEVASDNRPVRKPLAQVF